jgi:hypothetical protein
MDCAAYVTSAMIVKDFPRIDAWSRETIVSPQGAAWNVVRDRGLMVRRRGCRYWSDQKRHCLGDALHGAGQRCRHARPLSVPTLNFDSTATTSQLPRLSMQARKNALPRLGRFLGEQEMLLRSVNYTARVFCELAFQKGIWAQNAPNRGRSPNQLQLFSFRRKGFATGKMGRMRRRASAECLEALSVTNAMVDGEVFGSLCGHRGVHMRTRFHSPLVEADFI